MGVITVGPFDTFTPVVRVINYPFIFKDNAQVDKILDGPLGREILTDLEGVGFKGLAFLGERVPQPDQQQTGGQDGR